MTYRNIAIDKLLDNMLESLIHDKNYQIDRYLDSNIALGRVHLGIFNPEPQPLFNEDKSLCIILDGKIYGYKTELSVLKKRGYKFNLETDAEFCLNAYIEYGINFINKLNGNFVLLIYDTTKNKIFIANDRFGLRTHFYWFQDGTLLFAPEIKAILQYKSYIKKLDEEGIACFLAFGEFWDGKTLFKGIKQLPPASLLIYDYNDFTLDKYWVPKHEPDYNLTEQQIIEMLGKTFGNAVKIRVKENFKYGVSLSGGLDSRVVLFVISQEKQRKIFAYTFGREDCDEVKLGSKVSKKVNVEHMFLDSSPDLIVQHARQAIWLMDGINYLGVSFIYPLSKSIRNKIDVVLDGFILDVTLGGSFLEKKRLHSENIDILSRLLFQRRLFNDEEFLRLFNESYYNKIKDIPAQLFNSKFNQVKYDANHPGNINDLFFLNTRHAWFPVGNIQTRDIFEMSHPTVDNDFIDVLLKIPPELRYNHKIYREFLMKFFPELCKIPYNKTMVRPSAPLWIWKAGKYILFIKLMLKRMLWRFSGGRIYLPDRRSYVNFEEWFRTNENWKSFFEDLLLNKNCLYMKYINQDYVKNLFHEVSKGKKLRVSTYANKLVYLASFELFLRLFFNNTD